MSRKNFTKKFSLISILLCLFIVSCNKNIDKSENSKKYIFISHTRTDDNHFIDESAENIDYSIFDLIILGGDMSLYSSKDINTLEYLDSIFNLKSNSTLWTLGNHDYSNPDLIKDFTKRNLFYNYYKNGITFIVFDTQDSLSNITKEQLDLFNKTIDTLDNTKFLFVITHKLIWLYGLSDFEDEINSISNGKYGDCSYCLNPNNFYTDIYPKLVQIKNKGINVFCLTGDIGFKVKSFEYKSKEGIIFLSTGFDFKDKENMYLVFEHDLKNNYLCWKYETVLKQN